MYYNVLLTPKIIKTMKRLLLTAAIILVVGALYGQSLQKGNLIGTHVLTLELKPGFAPLRKLSNNIQEITATELAKINSEYAHLLSVYGNKVKPLIELKEYGSNEVVSKTGKGVSIRT